MSTTTQKLKRSAALVLMLMMLVSLIGAVTASAASSTVYVTGVSLASSDDSVVSDWEFNNNEIKGEAEFHKVGDALKLKITVQNNDGVPYKVSRVRDYVGNPYLYFDWSEAEGKTLNSFGTTDLFVTIKYKTGTDADALLAQADVDKYERVTEEEKSDLRVQTINSADMIFTLNYETPSTGDNSGTGTWLILLGCSALGLLVLALTGKKGKRAARFMGLLLAFMLVIPVSANATTFDVNVKFSAVVKLKDKLIVTYTGDHLYEEVESDEAAAGAADVAPEQQKVNEINEVVDYYDGKDYTLMTPVEHLNDGYDVFDGWYDGTDGTATLVGAAGATYGKDFENDITFYGKWIANTYKIVYNSNCATGTQQATGTMSDSTLTYDQSKYLAANGFTRTGYTFDGWATTPDGAKVYDNEALVTNLTKVNNATVNLYAHWTIENYSITYLKADGTTAETMATGAKTTYTIEDTTFSLAKPATATDFICWLDKTTGTPVTEITKGSTGAKTFVAAYKDTNGHSSITTWYGATNSGSGTTDITVEQKKLTEGWGQGTAEPGDTAVKGGVCGLNYKATATSGQTIMIDFTIDQMTQAANLRIDGNVNVGNETDPTDSYTSWIVIDEKKSDGDMKTGIALTQGSHHIQVFIKNTNSVKITNNKSTIGFDLSNAESDMTYHIKNLQWSVVTVG